MTMDPRAAKFHSRRTPQDADQLLSRGSDNVFHSETGQASHHRTHNLSDRVHEYYEKIVKNSQGKSSNISSLSHQLPSNVHNRFGDLNPLQCNPIEISQYNKQTQHQTPVTVRTAIQPNTNSGQPYTVYVEDPVGAFQSYQKKKSIPMNAAGVGSKNDACNTETSSSKVRTDNSLLPSASSSRPHCNLCHSGGHSMQSCTMKTRMPAEHDGCFSDPVLRRSPPKHLMKAHEAGKSPPAGCLENQGDGSEDKNVPSSSFMKKRTTPSNIDVRCERDVIGQERSPVSKVHPVSYAALSTSSSNGDSVPRGRKKWARPPAVGQASSSAEKSLLMNSSVFDCLDDSHEACSLEKRKISDDCLLLSSSTGSEPTNPRNSSKGISHIKSSYFNTSNEVMGCLPQNDKDYYVSTDRDQSSLVASQLLTSEGEQGLSDSCAGGRVSPSSSVTSNRRLEWDSGADVGYNQMYGSPSTDTPPSGLGTIERMALAQGCSVALQLRLDPEGTTVPASSSGLARPIAPPPVVEKSTPYPVGKPAAESTPQEPSSRLHKAISRCRNDSKNIISPILGSNQKDSKNNVVVDNEEEGGEMTHNVSPVQRQLSNSMQDLRKCRVIKTQESQLFKSQSDPDVSASSPTIESMTVQCKYPQNIFVNRNLTEGNMAAHSLSSGSDATLIHVGTEEDLSVDVQDNYDALNDPPNPVNTNCELPLQPESGSSSGPQSANSVVKQGNIFVQTEGQNTRVEKSSKPALTEDKSENVDLQCREAKTGSNTHVCSDTDHKRGLHHHFGVLCSTVLGGHIQSSVQPNEVSQQSKGLADVPVHLQKKHERRETSQSPAPQEMDTLTGESTGSSAFHSDNAQEENLPGTNKLTGRVNSFEYLPGHMYENNTGSGVRNHERPPGISTSTETDSEPVRVISRAMHRKVMDSSSHDTEDDLLWVSPRVGSNTLVQDLERGISLLKGVMENKSAGRRCKRELIRRVIKKLVTSEYVEDLMEKEKTRHQVRSPFSPRKSRYQDRPERNLRSKRTVGPERQEISGESDEPKERVHNPRRKINTHQSAQVSQGQRILSTVASASKSSSLWSSNADSSSGSISLSVSSDRQKESKTSVKPNPLYEPLQEGTAEWLKPATHSEKLFELRKNCVPHPESSQGGHLGLQFHEPALDPVTFNNDPQKQLSWVKNEISHLKILKQLLQKQETLKQNLDPNLCQSSFTVMPVTGMKQTMQMADCTSPDVPEAHSPKRKSSRLQQWISLESDTSAGFGLSNNTGSSHDSHWQEVEVASGGEHDNLPHRTVSISDGEQVTDASCSNSGRKSDCSPSSYPQRVLQTRRRSVSISDTDQVFGPHPITSVPIPKKCSDCNCGKPEGRTYNTRVARVTQAQAATYGPPSRNLSFDNNSKQPKNTCNCHSYPPIRREPSYSGGLRGAVNNKGGSSQGLHRIDSSAQQLDQKRTVSKVLAAPTCTCSNPSAPSKNSCSCGPPASLSSQSTGAVKKATVSSHEVIPRAGIELPSSSKQPLPVSGLVRVHIETDQNLDSAQEKSESLRSSLARDRVSITDVSDRERIPIMQSVSDDSLTKAVTEAVSSKVKALRNLGQIEEAEVKIRVKVGQSKACDDNVPANSKRVLKTLDLEEDQTSFPSKLTEMNDMIARQRAMDNETRQKLLAIAESRQQSHFGLNDIDRRIQDLLLQDYLSRQFKNTETSGTTQPRLNVSADAPPLLSSSVGVQIRVDRKTIGTSTGEHLNGRLPNQNNERYVQHQPSYESSPHKCICGEAPMKQPSYSQGQQTEVLSRPQTAPPSCQCSCQFQQATSSRTYRASPVLSSPERKIEFELELRKQHSRKLTPREVHETLKARNTAYFLQFEEDSSVGSESVKDVEKKPIEVVTVKIPKQTHIKAHYPSVGQPSSSQGSRTPSKLKTSKKSHDSQTLPPRKPSVGTSEFHEDNQSLPRQSVSSQDSRNISSPDTLHDERGPVGIVPDLPHDARGPLEINPELPHDARGPSGIAPDLPHDERDLLRVTPGRSHLSITITDSSADSIQSPEGDSRNSSSHHSARKPRKSSHPHKRKEKINVGSMNRDVSQNTVPKTDDIPRKITRQPSNESEAVYGLLGDVSNTVPSLQEYLEKNHPKYLDAAERRRRCIAEMSYLRRLRQQSRKRLLELDGENMWMKQKQQWRSRCASRPRALLRKKSSPKATKSALTRRYMFLPENQLRMADLKKKEEKRTNRLMAEIYTRKLQEKVLKGSATIRSSVSVISSL